MKRPLLAALALGLVLLLDSGSSAAPAPLASDARAHDVNCQATDDPVPVECPFCGGDPMLHAKRMNAIAVTTSRLAYQVLDASLF